MFFGRLVVDANGGVMAGILFLSWARIIQICAGAHQKWRGRPRFSDSLDRDRIAIEEAKVLSIPLTSGFFEILIVPDSRFSPIPDSAFRWDPPSRMGGITYLLALQYSTGDSLPANITVLLGAFFSTPRAYDTVR